MDVLARWGLRDALVEPVESGATNDTSRVTHDGQVRYLRRYRTTDVDAIRREHDLIERAAAAGVRTPRPIPAATNATVVRFDGAVFALFEAAAGRQLEPVDLGTSHAASAGAFLAHLHAVTAAMMIDGFRRPTLQWDGPAWAERIRATATLIPRDSASDLDRWAHERSMQQASWLDNQDCRHRYNPTTQPQVIHGDYQHANLFFRGADVVAVIDWDTAVAMCRGFEVVRACSFMFQLDRDRTSAFLSGYRAVSPLSATDLEAWDSLGPE